MSFLLLVLGLLFQEPGEKKPGYSHPEYRIEARQAGMDRPPGQKNRSIQTGI